MMDDKVAALLKMPPPEYTIAGEMVTVCACAVVMAARPGGVKREVLMA